jgi:transmembrane sensor
MNKNHIDELDPAASVTEQASHWWILLNDPGATEADRKAFGEWSSRSPERVEAFLQTARLTKALRSRTLRWPDVSVEILVREAKEGRAVIVPFDSTNVLEGSSGTRPIRRNNPMIFAMATVLLVIIAGAWAFLTGPERYTTAIGEQRSVVLGDGSVVTLNTSSNIEVKLAKNKRTIRLVAGEALFQVAHDKMRPFDVIAGDATVRAVGTQFNVDRSRGSTVITVVEGKVSVESGSEDSGGKNPDAGTLIPLSAGERVTVAPRVRLSATVANVATATAWTQRRLVFEHRSMGEVADEFNRYNRQIIEIFGTDLRNQEVTGVFQADDPNSFIDFVAKIPGVKIERYAEKIKILASN